MSEMGDEKISIVHIEANAQNLESWVAMSSENFVLGHIFMLIEQNDKIKFLDAWVHEEHRRKGIFRMLWDTRWEYVKENYSGYKVYVVEDYVKAQSDDRIIFGIPNEEVFWIEL